MQAGGLKRLYLVAGGTGGHICPAVAFGRWLSETVEDLEIVHVAGNRPLEREIYGSSGLDAVFLSFEGSPVGARGRTAANRWLQVMKALREMVRLFRNRPPSACILFGGYVCGGKAFRDPSCHPRAECRSRARHANGSPPGGKAFNGLANLPPFRPFAVCRGGNPDPGHETFASPGSLE